MRHRTALERTLAHRAADRGANPNELNGGGRRAAELAATRTLIHCWMLRALPMRCLDPRVIGEESEDVYVVDRSDLGADTVVALRRDREVWW